MFNTLKTSTLVKNLFVDIHTENAPNEQKYDFAVKQFGDQSAVSKMVLSKSFTEPNQVDLNALTATSQFLNLVNERSLLGQIKALELHNELPLKETLTAFDLEPCSLVPQAMPTAILNTNEELGFSLTARKIGGYAIFPESYFSSQRYSGLESLINNALIDSYTAGENADFVAAISTGALTQTATGATLTALLNDISTAAATYDLKSTVVLMNPQTALTLATDLDLALTVNGGTIRGITVFTDKSVPLNKKIVFDLSRLITGSDQTIDIRKTNQATVKSMTNQDVYLFQQNKVAVMVLGVNGYSLIDSIATVIEG